MNKIIIITIILMTILIITKAIFPKKRNKRKTNVQEEIPVKKINLLSNSESFFYQVLRMTIPQDKQISCKCRLEDIINIENCPKKEIYRNRIKSKHIDFVIFKPENGEIEFTIELDDKSHNYRKEEDEFKNYILEKANVPLIRIKNQKIYSITKIKEEIKIQSKNKIAI